MLNSAALPSSADVSAGLNLLIQSFLAEAAMVSAAAFEDATYATSQEWVESQVKVGPKPKVYLKRASVKKARDSLSPPMEIEKYCYFRLPQPPDVSLPPQNQVFGRTLLGMGQPCTRYTDMSQASNDSTIFGAAPVPPLRIVKKSLKSATSITRASRANRTISSSKNCAMEVMDLTMRSPLDLEQALRMDPQDFLQGTFTVDFGD